MEFQVSTLFINKLLQKKFRKHCLIGDKKFFDPYTFAVAKELEDNFDVIKKETEAILKRYDDLTPFQLISPDQLYISNDDKWRLFFFKAANINFKKIKNLHLKQWKLLTNIKM
mgnify:CR=1 FL=1